MGKSIEIPGGKGGRPCVFALTLVEEVADCGGGEVREEEGSEVEDIVEAGAVGAVLGVGVVVEGVAVEGSDAPDGALFK